jgi:hypothetical protein
MEIRHSDLCNISFCQVMIVLLVLTKKWLTLLANILGTMMVPINASITNVSHAHIQYSLE